MKYYLCNLVSVVHGIFTILELDDDFQITIQRTELNSPLGLEVQLHITEAVCPALSEPGLFRNLLIFCG